MGEKQRSMHVQRERGGKLAACGQELPDYEWFMSIGDGGHMTGAIVLSPDSKRSVETPPVSTNGQYVICDACLAARDPKGHLMRCPFCGDRSSLTDIDDGKSPIFWRVECDDDTSCGAQGPVRADREAAVAAWNGRK